MAHSLWPEPSAICHKPLALGLTPYFDVRARLNDRQQVGDLIDRGDVIIALQINSGFAQNLYKGQLAHLQVLVVSIRIAAEAAHTEHAQAKSSRPNWLGFAGRGNRDKPSVAVAQNWGTGQELRVSRLTHSSIELESCP
jgi:hypothetical protein